MKLKLENPKTNIEIDLCQNCEETIIDNGYIEIGQLCEECWKKYDNAIMPYAMLYYMKQGNMR